MKKLATVPLLLLLLCFIPRIASAEAGHAPVEQVLCIDGSSSYTCVYCGDTRKFIVCLPEEKKSPLPAIFMLHGSGSNAESFRLAVKMEQDACRQGYAVVYLSAAKNKISRTIPPAWNSGISETGVDDAGFITALAEYMWDAFGFDRQRTYLAGFSNGAFMVHRMAAEGSDVFSGYASVGGMMPEKVWNNRDHPGKINFLQINGTKDDAVPMHLNGSAQTSKAPAIEDVISFYASEAALTECASEELCPNTTIDKYTDAEKSAAVWFTLIGGGHHAWPVSSDSGFNANDLILDFFNTIGENAP